MAKKLRCTMTPSDFVRVSDWRGDSDIALQVKVGEKTEDIFLTFSDAKKLRKQIKSALAEIESEPEEDASDEKEEPAYIPHVGEIVEVYRNTAGHGFRVGQKVRVQATGNGLSGCYAKSLDARYDSWAVTRDIRPIQNWKPQKGEKVLIVDSTFVPTATTRSWVGKFGIIRTIWDSVVQVYNEDKSDWLGFSPSDLRPAE